MLKPRRQARYILKQAYGLLVNGDFLSNEKLDEFVTMDMRAKESANSYLERCFGHVTRMHNSYAYVAKEVYVNQIGGQGVTVKLL